MSTIDPRTLEPGQQVKWTRTVVGTVDVVGDRYVTVNTGVGAGYHSLPVVASDGMVDTWEIVSDGSDGQRPVPTLPTEFGAMILAHLDGLRKVHPRLLQLGQHNDEDVWFVVGADMQDWHSRFEILPGWVQIDPATLQPVGANTPRSAQ